MKHLLAFVAFLLLVVTGFAQKLPDTDHVYHIFNPALCKYIMEGEPIDYDEDVRVAIANDSCHGLWRFEDAGGDCFRIRNAVTGRYLAPTEDQKEHYYAVLGDTTKLNTRFRVTVNEASGLCNIQSCEPNGWYANLATYNCVVNRSLADTGESDWLIDEATPEELAVLAREKARQEEIDEMKTVGDATLRRMFADAACTTLAQPYRDMADDAFEDEIAGLHPMLRDMAMKVKTGRWATIGTSGANWDKAFRIGHYQVSSDHIGMSETMDIHFSLASLDNPTGIAVAPDSLVVIMVGDEYDLVPEDTAGVKTAPLYIVFKKEDANDECAPSSMVPLSKGLNVVRAEMASQLFVCYEIRGADDDESHYLSHYPDITIQIAGGTVCGCFDTTRPGVVADTPSMTDADWAAMVADGLFDESRRVQMKHGHVMLNFARQELLDVERNRTSILPVLEMHDTWVKWEEELMGFGPMWDRDDYFYHTAHMAQRYRNVWNVTSGEFDYGYMYAWYNGIYYWNESIKDVTDVHKLTTAPGANWGPVHEFGHQYQHLINMIGCTEVSNNLFSNVMQWRAGTATSRGLAMSVLPDHHANGTHWLDYDIWEKTQLYWKLYQYFHLAGHKTDFYPRLFDELRQNRLNRRANCIVPASEDYLRFALACCKVADADLSELFDCYGFFRPLAMADTFDNVLCHHVGDYGDFYIRATDEEVEEARAEMRSYKTKIPNLMFIDDRIVATPATFPGAKEGDMRQPTEEKLGSQGDVGQWTCFVDSNYVAAGRCRATWRENADGTVDIEMEARDGSVGYKVYDEKGRLVYFSAFNSFTLPKSVGASDMKRHTVMVADAKGHDMKAKLKKGEAAKE